MKFGVRIAACVAALAMLGAAQAAQAAQVVDWTISDGAFEDGGAFSGTFTWDVSSSSITDWNVVTTDGTVRTGQTYATTPFFFFGGASSFGSVTEFHNGFFIGTEFDLGNLTPSSAGTVSALTGAEYDYAFNPFSGFVPSNVRNITAGSAVGVLTGVPEPATWSLMILGAGLAGASLRRRRRSALV